MTFFTGLRKVQALEILLSEALNNRNVDGSKFKKKHIEQVIQNLRIKQQARMKIRFVKLGIVSFHILSHNHP